MVFDSSALNIWHLLQVQPSFILIAYPFKVDYVLYKNIPIISIINTFIYLGIFVIVFV